MKYNTNNTTLCGYLTKNNAVTIKLINTRTDSLVSATDYDCVESANQEGLYYFDTGKINETFETLEIAYVMQDELSEIYGGKIVLDGSQFDINDKTKLQSLENCDSSNVIAKLETIESKDNFNQDDRVKLFELENYDETGMRSRQEEIAVGLDEKTTLILEEIEAGNQDVEQIIKDVQLGNWQIVDNQMIMKSRLGLEIARFNLYDLDGNPTMKSIFERVGV